MGTIASQITSLPSVYSTVYSGADQSKHQSSASLAFVWGIHRGPVNSPHKWPVTRKMFPFDDVIMWYWFTLVAIMFCSALWVSIIFRQIGFWTKFPQKYILFTPWTRHLSRALSVKLIRITRYRLCKMSSSGISSAKKLPQVGIA